MPPERRVHAEEAKEIVPDDADVDQLRSLLVSEDPLAPGGDRPRVEGLRAVSVVEVVELVHRGQVLGTVAHLVPDDRDAIAVPVR